MRDLSAADHRGTLITEPQFASAWVPTRRVDIWLPPGYAAAPERRYPVIYMHDGQMLFDPALAFNGEVWAVDRAVTRLMEAEQSSGAIIVGIWNTPERRSEYMPQRYLALDAVHSTFLQWTGGTSTKPRADAYLRFLVDELKPQIDASLRTLPTPEHTLVMGSSMGGLISLYALTEHPLVFGAAACVSTHWTAGGNGLVDGLAAALPPPGRHRLYFDYGTLGLDAAYEPFQQRMNGHLRAAGYVEGRDFLSRRFDGADHNEPSWRARVELPLRFMLGLPLLAQPGA